MQNLPTLPPSITVLERGWLSSNNILIQGRTSTALIDSGYCLHAPQTLALVQAALAGRPLDVLVNTHLHSDHCGGNAQLQAHYPALQTLIPPGHSEHVRNWDPNALTFVPTGQNCPPFTFDAALVPGTELRLGDLTWQVHAAAAHDPHSVILFEPDSRTLVSADALWERGFGVVFPELEGIEAFAAVGDTLDLIEQLSPKIVIPGHGPVFSTIETSLATARARLAGFVQQPEKHITYAAKVLLKFKLLEAQSLDLNTFITWADTTPYFRLIFNTHFSDREFSTWVQQLIADLVRSGAAVHEGPNISNAG